MKITLGAKRYYWGLQSDIHNFRGVFPLVSALREFFSHPITLKECEDKIRMALNKRESNFLELVGQQIYQRSNSPYLKLLKHAGCDFSDLRESVQRHGIENTLGLLAKEGVYLTSSEYKGKKDVVRGQLSFRVSPKDFRRMDYWVGFVTQSSGTRNPPEPSFNRLDWLGVRALAMAIFFSAHDLFSYAHAVYDAILPSSSINQPLLSSKVGKVTDRWFVYRIPSRTWLNGLYNYLSTYEIVIGGKWFGPGFPKPEFADRRDVRRIVLWIAEKKQHGQNTHITTVVSNAVRIARAAWELGVSLERTKFTVTGEPLTPAKYDVIKRAGATTTNRYAYGGGVNIGFGCANPAHLDDIHVNQHMLALISHPEPLYPNGPPIYPLLCSTLDPAAPSFLFNVESGDYATFEPRNCGCALGSVGLGTHIHHIRSFEKLNAEGMNYFYTDDLYDLVENILPVECGGGPGDYQLVEEEDNNGQTRLTLFVHPDVGDVKEEKLLARLKKEIGKGSWNHELHCRIWERANSFRVKREVPHTSPRGKILPFHMRRSDT